MPDARRCIVVLTGAGVSADSGVATFRGPEGLWEGHRIEDVATPEGWARDARLVWRFYQTRRAQLRSVEPNPAHLALARLEQELAARGDRFALVTQNVDDLHERAGSRAIHMHGELASLLCERCGERVRDEASLDPEAFLACPHCERGRLRPDIVWFGEIPYRLDEIGRWLRECTHFLAIGTSGVVYPAAGFLQAARAYGATTCVTALDEPENLHVADRFVGGRAAEVVPRLAEELLAGE